MNKIKGMTKDELVVLFNEQQAKRLSYQKKIDEKKRANGLIVVGRHWLRSDLYVEIKRQAKLDKITVSDLLAQVIETGFSDYMKKK